MGRPPVAATPQGAEGPLAGCVLAVAGDVKGRTKVLEVAERFGALAAGAGRPAATHVLVGDEPLGAAGAARLRAEHPGARLVGRTFVTHVARARDGYDRDHAKHDAEVAGGAGAGRGPPRAAPPRAPATRFEDACIENAWKADPDNPNWAVVDDGSHVDGLKGTTAEFRVLRCRHRADDAHGNEHIVRVLKEMEKLYRAAGGEDSTAGMGRRGNSEFYRGEEVWVNHEALTCARAASVVRLCPYTLKRAPRRGELDFVGEYGRKVIGEVLQTGTCEDLEELRRGGEALVNSDGINRGLKCAHVKRELVRLPTVGYKMAAVWTEKHGIKTWDDVDRAIREGRITQDPRVRHAVANRDELLRPISRDDVDRAVRVVGDTLRDRYGGGWHIEVVGGARRSQANHDCDLLVTNWEWPSGWCGRWERVLADVVDDLVRRSFLVAHDVGFHMLHQGKMPTHIDVIKANVSAQTRGFENMDVFDRFFGLCTPEPGRMHRIDVVLVPPEEWGFALVGWTGSRQYNRFLRQHALSCGMMLNSHGLFRKAGGPPRMVPSEAPPTGRDGKERPYPEGLGGATSRAPTEQDVFALLGLQYRLPSERDCPV